MGTRGSFPRGKNSPIPPPTFFIALYSMCITKTQVLSYKIQNHCIPHSWASIQGARWTTCENNLSFYTGIHT